MAIDVKVKIELSKVIGKLGFGYPLILDAGAESAVGYTECSNIEEVVEAGFTDTTTIYKAANLVFMQDNAPSKIAVCATTTDAKTALPSLIGKDWRQLIVVGISEQTKVEEIADYIETTQKMYFATLSALTKIDGKTYDRTVIFVNSETDAVAALVGEASGRKAGSFTYKNLILKGVTPSELTNAEINTIHNNGGIALVVKAGDNVTTEGKSQSGEYIDITDSVDYVTQQIEYNVQKVLNNNDKVPYDDSGISLLESTVTSVLQDAYNNGIIAQNADGEGDYSVSFAARSDTTESDRVSRIYPYGNFSFALAGAIHSVEVNGTITF